MKSYVDEIIQEWIAKLPELLEIKQKIIQENIILKKLRGSYVFIKKYFIFKNNTKGKIEISHKQKNLIKVKSSSLNALNIAKERELMKLKKAYDNLIQLKEEELDDPFKQDFCKEDVNKEILENVKQQDTKVDKSLEIQNNSKSEVKKKMKSLLNAFRSKSQKTCDQNKENIPDHSVMIEDGEVKLFIVNKKKRMQDYLKESKRKKKKGEYDKFKKDSKEQDVKKKEHECDGKENEPLKEEFKENKQVKTPKEESKENKQVEIPKERFKAFVQLKAPEHNKSLNGQVKESNEIKQQPNSTIFDLKKRFLKQNSPEKVYDVGTNRFIPSSELQSTSSSQHLNLKYLCRTPLKDGLYKNIIDKERRSRSRIGMNEFIPKLSVPEITSDDEENNEVIPLSEKEILEALQKQKHEEIEKYFNSELTIDIELLFPNIKELSNDSPNKWA